MVIAGAGIEHDVLVAEASKYFGSVPSTAPNGKEAYAEPAIYTGSDYRLREDSRPVAHVAYAFPIAGWYDADNFALSIIQTLIGSWSRGELGHAGVHSQSQLVSNVASTNCATSVSTFNTQYSDTGLFGIYATTNGSQGQYDMMRFLTRALTELCYNVDEAQLEEAKTLLKMTMLSHLDSTSTICEDIGRQTLLYGRRMHPTEFVARIDAVDANAVKQTAERYFYDRDHVLAAIGPIYELPDYNWIRRLSYWLRY
jgi:processing peptidase subunit beta